MLKTRGLGASGKKYIKKCISIIKKSLSKHTKSKNTSCKVNNSFMFKFVLLKPSLLTAGNRHKQNSWFCKEIREDNFRFWWRRVHEDASQGMMYMSKIEILVFTARIL